MVAVSLVDIVDFADMYSSRLISGKRGLALTDSALATVKSPPGNAVGLSGAGLCSGGGILDD